MRVISSHPQGNQKGLNFAARAHPGMGFMAGAMALGALGKAMDFDFD